MGVRRQHTVTSNRISYIEKWRWSRKSMSSTSTALPKNYFYDNVFVYLGIPGRFHKVLLSRSSVDVVFLPAGIATRMAVSIKTERRSCHFHVKLLAFVFLWLRYNVNDFLKLIHKCIHRQRESKYSHIRKDLRKGRSIRFVLLRRAWERDKLIRNSTT